MSPIYQFIYPFNTYALLTELEYYRAGFKAYEDVRYDALDNWKVLRDKPLRVLTKQYYKFCNDTGLEGKPRYYILDGNSVLPPHVDLNTECSINHLLSGNAAPITYTGHGNFEYKTALINTKEEHSVNNTEHNDRYLFKISFFDYTFEEVKEKILAYEARTKV